MTVTASYKQISSVSENSDYASGGNADTKNINAVTVNNSSVFGTNQAGVQKFCAVGKPFEMKGIQTTIMHYTNRNRELFRFFRCSKEIWMTANLNFKNEITKRKQQQAIFRSLRLVFYDRELALTNGFLTVRYETSMDIAVSYKPITTKDKSGNIVPRLMQPIAENFNKGDIFHLFHRKRSKSPTDINLSSPIVQFEEGGTSQNKFTFYLTESGEVWGKGRCVQPSEVSGFNARKIFPLRIINTPIQEIFMSSDRQQAFFLAENGDVWTYFCGKSVKLEELPPIKQCMIFFGWVCFLDYDGKLWLRASHDTKQISEHMGYVCSGTTYICSNLQSEKYGSTIEFFITKRDEKTRLYCSGTYEKLDIKDILVPINLLEIPEALLVPPPPELQLEPLDSVFRSSQCLVM